MQMAKYQVPQRSGDIVMIQSEHTGAIDVLSADLESADLLGDHRKGETFGSKGGGLFPVDTQRKAGRQTNGRKENDLWKEVKAVERMSDCANLS